MAWLGPDYLPWSGRATRRPEARSGATGPLMCWIAPRRVSPALRRLLDQGNISWRAQSTNCQALTEREEKNSLAIGFSPASTTAWWTPDRARSRSSCAPMT